MSAEHVVFAFVGALQVYYLARCIFLARADFHKKLTDLKDRFENDIRARARRGLDPDWVHYGDETDRLHDQSSDTLRVYATTALATGIGGTIVALCLHLLPYFSVDTIAVPVDRIQRLLEEFGIALLSSAVGVVNNLIILLILLPLAQRRFGKALTETQATLRTVSTENTPTEMLADAVRSQLGEAFRDAVAKFPEAFAHLEGSMEALGRVIEAQSATVVAASDDLKTSAVALAEASGQLTPATAELSSSVAELRTLPAALASTLDEARGAWTDEIRSDQQAFLEQIRNTLAEQKEVVDRISAATERQEARLRTWTDDIVGAVNDVVETANGGLNSFAGQMEEQATDLVGQLKKVLAEQGAVVAEVADAAKRQAEHTHTWTAKVIDAVNDVPQTFADHIRQQADTLGSRFGLEARNQVADLTQALNKGDEKLRKQLEANANRLQNTFLNNTGDVVVQTLTKIEKPLLDRLDEIGRGLQEAMVNLPAHARGFADSLSAADRKLRNALDGIGRSAEHLDRVARVTEDFETKLAKSLQEATSEHLDSFAPLRNQMSEFVSGLHSTYSQINNTIATQVTFIEQLIERLAQRRTRP